MEQTQSIDSALPGFIMPDKWLWRRVDASNGPELLHDVILIGRDTSDANPYCVTDEKGKVTWTKSIRFTD